MRLTEELLRQIVLEELTKSDKAEVKKIISKEIDTFEKRFEKILKPIVEKELKKILSSKEVKADVADISKKILKKLYKDLSFQHPYIIDRIKL
tara:strand:- start:69 stop:347 length:279 start_codon:yes stop_codon:yes gene_type:complete